ncbi:MAG: iron-containing alcohol dehydrogenase, partial [Planctomycetaceae bacterium]|nr:iron-containing alcohol dehydrogenase [Planctomycetaceae bacterium]
LPALAEAVEAGTSRKGRESMAHAALLSGIALANSGLGMAHGIAPALGIHCHIPHGLACAVMLPATLKTNLSVRQKEYAEITRFIAPELSLSETEAAQYLIDQIEALNDRIHIPRNLASLGVTHAQIPALVASSRGNSMSGNPRALSDAELTRILEDLL